MSTKLESEPEGTIEVRVRSSRPPYETTVFAGYNPFECYGERFAITRIPAALNDQQQWRGTHVETGAGVPLTESATIKDALAKTMTVLTRQGADKLQAALAKIKKLLSETNP